jgi:hypothetical protein
MSSSGGVAEGGRGDVPAGAPAGPARFLPIGDDAACRCTNRMSAMVLRDLEQVSQAIERFVAGSKCPAVLEPGDDQILLGRDNYVLDRRGGRLQLEAWDTRRNLSRRVTGIEQQKPGALQLTVERFGQRPGTLMLMDLGRPARGVATPRQLGARLRFREQFRRFLMRQFPSWTLAELSSEQDLEHSLSPAFSRALVRKGAVGWAAMGAPALPTAGSALAFGLIWLDHLRRRERKLVVEGLALFVPVGAERTACQRVLWLDSRQAHYTVFAYSDSGLEERIDPRDHGNLESRLEPRAGMIPQPDAGGWRRRLAGAAATDVVERNDGALSFRVRGVEFARFDGAGMRFGIDAKRSAAESNTAEILALATYLDRMRSPDQPAAAAAGPLWSRNPELWLESQVRSHLDRIDPRLIAEPLYGQVPALSGGDRGVIDLVAGCRDGGLAVLELKASQDLQLPLQALDYWMRVRHHAAAGDFARAGYFPALEPARCTDPRLLLVAPALEFHPTTETILRYFGPQVPVERIGLGQDWRRNLNVVFRAHGAHRPGVAG